MKAFKTFALTSAAIFISTASIVTLAAFTGFNPTFAALVIGAANIAIMYRMSK